MSGLVFKLFARQKPLFDALCKEFAPYLHDVSSATSAPTTPNSASNKAIVEIYNSDVFTADADALVSPANSFGFMDGGFDDLILKRAGLQLQRRLQDLIRSRESGELLVGRALVLEMVADSEPAGDNEWDGTAYLSNKYPERPSDLPLPFRYLIAAPTMRLPEVVDDTVNAYLAFRAIILAVMAHNSAVASSTSTTSTSTSTSTTSTTSTSTSTSCATATDESEQTAEATAASPVPSPTPATKSDSSTMTGPTPILSVACTGLCTGVGRMPPERCARQMRIAFEHTALGLQKISVALPPPGAPRTHVAGHMNPTGMHLTDYFDVNDLLLK